MADATLVRSTLPFDVTFYIDVDMKVKVSDKQSLEYPQYQMFGLLNFTRMKHSLWQPQTLGQLIGYLWETQMAPLLMENLLYYDEPRDQELLPFWLPLKLDNVIYYEYDTKRENTGARLLPSYLLHENGVKHFVVRYRNTIVEPKAASTDALQTKE